jgi:hypothetical protein
LDSTHPKDSNKVLFVIFGQIFYFLSILQDAAAKMKFEFRFEIDLTGLTEGGLTGHDVARHHWSIPIR